MSIVTVVFLDEGAQGETQLGGGQLARLSLMEYLDKKKFKTILITSFDGELAREARNRGIDVYILSTKYQIPRFARRDMLKKPLHLFRLSLFFLTRSYQLAKKVKELKADVLHPNENLSRTISIISKFWHKVPIVTHIDGEWNKGFTDMIMRVFFQRFFNKLIAVSEGVSKYFKKKDNIIIIHEGINPNKFKHFDTTLLRKELQQSRDVFLLGTVGKLIEFKGQGLVLKALKEIKDAGIKNFKYVLLGSGPDLNLLQDSVAELKLEEHIVFMGFRNDVDALLPGLNCLIHPSFTEAFPLTVIEAGFAKVPVIATNVGGIPEVIEHDKSGWLIEAGNINAIIESLRKVLMSPNEQLLLYGENLYKVVSTKYSLESCVIKTQELYETLIKSNKKF